MHTLSQGAYSLWQIARDAGFTPRELSSSNKYGKYTISIEQLVPNAIALCYTGEEDVESILVALRQLNELGVVPVAVDSSTIFFTADHQVIFLTTSYSRGYGSFNREKYADLVSSLTGTTHTKWSIERDEIVMYMQAASIGAAPDVIEVLESYSLVTHKYPYSLVHAAQNGVKLNTQAKLGLEAKMHSLHSLGILHRDITEGNFVCNLAGTKAWIIDFSLSVRVDTVSLDTLREYIEDFEYEGDMDGDRNELVRIAKDLEMTKLVILFRHF
ncbi:Hypothetical protein POVR2_LOCUS252 [uncultured virus]|nr:Hypothetical protein POVR2_LOCUS252 [uncultured virus]